ATTAPATITAGGSTAVTVTAYHAHGNAATGYPRTVHLNSSHSHAALPAHFIFIATLHGSHPLHPPTLNPTGPQALTAPRTATPHTANPLLAIAAVPVKPAAARRLVLIAPSDVVKDDAHDLTVTAYDAYGNVAPGYTGTVHFSSSDGNPNVNLPDDYTFTAADGGRHTFSGVSLHSHGQKSITAPDMLAPSIFGMLDRLVLNPGGQ